MLNSPPQYADEELSRRDQARLDQERQERILRIAEIQTLAMQRLGGKAAGMSWLNTPNLALGGVAPILHATTAEGAALVDRLLAAFG